MVLRSFVCVILLQGLLIDAFPTGESECDGDPGVMIQLPESGVTEFRLTNPVTGSSTIVGYAPCNEFPASVSNPILPEAVEEDQTSVLKSQDCDETNNNQIPKKVILGAIIADSMAQKSAEIDAKLKELDAFVESEIGTIGPIIQSALTNADTSKIDSCVDSALLDMESQITSELSKLDDFLESELSKTEELVESVIRNVEAETEEKRDVAIAENDALIKLELGMLESCVESTLEKSESLVDSELKKVNALVEQEMKKIDSLVESQLDKVDMLIEKELEKADTVINSEMTKMESLVDVESTLEKSESLVDTELKKVNALVEQEMKKIDSLVESQLDKVDMLIEKELEKADTVINSEMTKMESLVDVESTLEKSESLVDSELKKVNALVEQEMEKIDSLVESQLDKVDMFIEKVLEKADAVVKSEMTKMESLVENEMAKVEKSMEEMADSSNAGSNAVLIISNPDGSIIQQTNDDQVGPILIDGTFPVSGRTVIIGRTGCPPLFPTGEPLPCYVESFPVFGSVDEPNEPAFMTEDLVYDDVADGCTNYQLPMESPGFSGVGPVTGTCKILRAYPCDSALPSINSNLSPPIVGDANPIIHLNRASGPYNEQYCSISQNNEDFAGIDTVIYNNAQLPVVKIVNNRLNQGPMGNIVKENVEYSGNAQTAGSTRFRLDFPCPPLTATEVGPDGKKYIWIAKK